MRYAIDRRGSGKSRADGESSRAIHRCNGSPAGRPRSGVLVGALVWLVVMGVASSVGWAGPADEDMAFQKNLDLLHVQMKIKALSMLRDNDFFVPKTLL